MVLNRVPHDLFVNDIIAVYQDISETYDAMILRDLLEQVLVNPAYPVEGFTYDFEISFNGPLRNRAVLVSNQIHPANEVVNFFG